MTESNFNTNMFFSVSPAANDNTNVIDLNNNKDEELNIEDFYQITEKTWAYLTIKQLLERSEAEENTTVIDDLKTRAKELALKVGLLCIYSKKFVLLLFSTQ